MTNTAMHTRIIPSSGAALPVIGVGTYKGFDVGAGAAQRAALAKSFARCSRPAASVIDSSPMYGRAEGVVGDLLAAERTQDTPFLATKVWTQGRRRGDRADAPAP